MAGCWGQRSGSIERIEETLASTQQRLAANEAHIKSLLSTQVWRRCIAFTLFCRCFLAQSSRRANALVRATAYCRCRRGCRLLRLGRLPSSCYRRLLQTQLAAETLSLSLNSLAFRAADGKHEGGDQIGRPLDQKFRWSLEAIPLRSVSAPSP